MNRNETDTGTIKDTRLAAWIASVGVIGGFIVYWWQEIEAVREMLKLAYG